MIRSRRLLLALPLLMLGFAVTRPADAADPVIVLEHWTNFR